MAIFPQTLPAGTVVGRLSSAGPGPAEAIPITSLPSGNAQAVNVQTGAAYTLQSTDNQNIVTISNAGAISVTLPNSLPAGFNCVIEQEGAGQITFAAGSGASLQSAGGANKSLEQYATVFAFVISNAGSNAAWRISGMLTI